MQFVKIEVEVPKGYESVIQATAAALREREQEAEEVNASTALAIINRVVQERLYEPPFSHSRPNPHAVQQLCREVGSRARNVFIEVEEVAWPIKALYFIVWNALALSMGRIPYNRPTDYNTVEALEFFEGLGFQAIRKGSEAA